MREQQKTQELGRLQVALSKLINEAGKRTRLEVDNVRKQCNTNIGKLMEEIQSLEMVSGSTAGFFHPRFMPINSCKLSRLLAARVP